MSLFCCCQKEVCPSLERERIRQLNSKNAQKRKLVCSQPASAVNSLGPEHDNNNNGKFTRELIKGALGIRRKTFKQRMKKTGQRKC